MNVRSYTRPARGMTLLEVAVSVAIISAVILTTVTVMKISAEHMGFQQIIVDQQAHTRASLDNMIAELRCLDGTKSDFDTNVTSSTDAKAKNDTLNDTYMKDSSNNYMKDSVRFIIPAFDTGSNTVKALYTPNMTVQTASVATAITYKYTWDNQRATGRIERFVGDPNVASNMTNVVLDGVPQGGFQIVKNGRRLAIRIGQENETPVNTSNGTKITTFITQITYCLRNY